jgi:hypothetical protein
MLGAPDRFRTPARIAFINAQAKGHPVILAATAQFLSKQQWRFTEKEFDGLCRNHHTSEIAPEVRNRLMQIVSREARDLLYRLNIIGAEFSEEDAEAIASVHPPILRHNEQLASLRGYCIQRETITTMSVSPVFQMLGATDVPANIRRSCHALIGDRLVVERRLNPLTGMRAISHFVQAGQAERAAIVLLSGLRSLMRAKREVHDYGILTVWINQPLPKEIRTEIRILLRSWQIALNAKRGLDVQYLIGDLASLAESAGPEELPSMLMGSSIAGHVIADTDFDCACRLWQRTLAFLQSAHLPDNRSSRIPKGVEVQFGVWALAGKIRTAKHLYAWINMVDSLSAEQRSFVFADNDSPRFSLVVANRLWLSEFEKDGANRNWIALQEPLIELAKAARRWDTEVLWACAQRTQIITLGENLKDTEACVALAKDGLNQASCDPHVRFLLEEALGSQLLYARRNDEARIWLQKALLHPVADLSTTRFFAHLNCSYAIGDTDARAAVEHAEAAVAIAKAAPKDDPIPEPELIKAMGELAIAHHFAGDLKSAFVVWDEAARLLLSTEHDTADWKELFVVFGHVSGYLSVFARTGRGPESASDGGEYAAPYRGLFATNNPQRVQLYAPEKRVLLPSHLAIFATAVGDEGSAHYWGERAIAATRETEQLQLLSVLAWDLIPLYLKQGKFDEAISLAIEASNITAAGIKIHRAGATLWARVDVEAILGPKSNPEWLSAEKEAMLLLCVPLVAHLGRLALDRPDTAALEVTRAITAIRRFAGTALDKVGWEAIGAALERGLLGADSEKGLIAFGNSFDQNDFKAVVITAYLCAGMRDRGDTDQAVRAQLAIMPYVDTYFAHYPAAHSIIVEYVTSFWRNAVLSMPFRFSIPKMVQESLEASQRLSGSARLRSVLSHITTSLGVRVHDKERYWLSTGRMADTQRS